MEFQIVELNDAKENKKLFFIQTGKVIREPWFLCFTRKKIVWEWLKSKPEATEADSFISFDYALQQIEELKRQLPVYHRIK